MNKEFASRIKRFDELEYRDDYMFGKVMEDMNLCHDVLECLLQCPVGELREVRTQREFKYTTDGKPIKIDIYSEDDKSVFDAEMQNLNHHSIESLNLPKRSRFYQAAMDIDHLNKSEDYSFLPDNIVLFICTFDPFGMGLGQYTFRNRCDEANALLLNDNTVKYFYNCTYKGSDISEELRKFYEYVMDGKAESELTRKIDGAVGNVRLNNEWRSSYMKERALFMDLRREGREEGRELLVITNVCKKLLKGKSIPQIADELEEDEEHIKTICDIAAKYAPGYDTEKILEEVFDLAEE